MSDERPKRVKWEKLKPGNVKLKYELALRPDLIRLARRMRTSVITEQLIDDIFNDLTISIHKISDKLPKAKFRIHQKPYWNDVMDLLKAAKIKDYRMWVNAGRPRNPDHYLYMRYKISKKAFLRRLSELSREFENAEILNAVKMAELDRNCFWRLIKKARKASGSTSIGIRNSEEKVVHGINEVLNVWKAHFEKLGTPTFSEEYDNKYYTVVTDRVRNLFENKGGDNPFYATPFTQREIHEAIMTQNGNKAPGFDNVTGEHIKYAGETIDEVLLLLYNSMMDLEYVPVCCRTGVQVPLYKGKDTCTLDPNNYRGITLLSVFNKIYEILLWKRIQGWWTENETISDLQFACKKGLSCTPAAFLLRETVATSLEDGSKCFVAFCDVAKAFDTVWIDDLFIQLWEMGIRGKVWRMLYLCYQNFRCCMKVQGHMSAWYELKCGIHQGGYMSLIKYTAFINSLLTTVQNSRICCKIYRTPSAPVGYADHLAACCRQQRDLKRVMQIVHAHGRTWRFDFSAKKSGVLVFGENKREHQAGKNERFIMLGNERVEERENYDHVGFRACIFEDDLSGIEERSSKGRRALNAISGLGIRRNGLTIHACCVIFWSIVIPIATFGAELWPLDDRCLSLLESFQTFVGKRIQRFGPKSPNLCTYFALGWMRIQRFIEIKKLLFIHSILSRDELDMVKVVFINRAKYVFDNIEICESNEHGSPVYDMLNIAIHFGIIEIVKNMVYRGHLYSRAHWRERIWKRAWELEEVYWCIETQGFKVHSFFNRHNLTAANMLPFTTGPVDTCVGPNFTSTLDYIAVSADVIPDVERCNVLGYDVLNTSDHQPVICVMKWY